MQIKQFVDECKNIFIYNLGKIEFTSNEGE